MRTLTNTLTDLIWIVVAASLLADLGRWLTA